MAATKTKKMKKTGKTKRVVRKPEKKKKKARVVPPPKPEIRDVKWLIRKLVPATTTVLGIGYILPNIAVVILLSYFISQLSVSSLQTITQISGVILFLMASIVLMVVGVFLILGGIQYHKKNPPPETMFLGVLLASFYLLCLGAGSALLLSEINLSVVLLIVSPIFIMVSAAIYMVPSYAPKLVGYILGIVGGSLLAVGIFTLQPLSLAFDGWDVPFPGPLMSMAVMEGIAIISGSIAVATHSILSKRREKPVSYVLLSIVGLIYGIGVFIGPLVLSFSFLDLIWKAPWGVGPLSVLPNWIRDTTVFWSASLILLEIGGIMLILSSCLGFTFATREFSRLYAPSSKKKGGKRVAKSKIVI